MKDARTVDTLAKAAKAKLPAMVRCDASKAAGLDAAAMKAGKAVKTVKADAKALGAAVKAVETSKLGKTVDDAETLYKATDGKVQDEKTREALKQAIAKRDADAIAKAVKAVNDSKTAKEKADAEAAAKAEQEAQAASGGSQSAGGSGYSLSSYSGGTASAGRSSGSTGGWSYSGGSASSGNGGGASGGNGGSTSGMPYIPSTSTGHGSYGEDSNGNWHDDFTPDPNEGGEVWW